MHARGPVGVEQLGELWYASRQRLFGPGVALPGLCARRQALIFSLSHS